VNTLAAFNVCVWSFPVGCGLSAGGSLSTDGSLFDGGSASAGGRTVGCIFGLRPQTASGTNR